MTRLLALFFVLLLPAFAADTLRIFWIDVEGGAATLIVTPGGDTVLMDAGWSGFESRDAKRIQHVLKDEAEREKINYFITSHFHSDHVGGLEQLGAIVEIEKFVDHGDSVEKDSPRGGKLWDSYLKVAKGKRLTIEPGDTLPLTGAELTFVAARGKAIAKPLGSGVPNSYCASAQLKEEDTTENGKSVGFVLKMGDFEFLDLGDLTWNFEHELVCPVNRIGEVDVYQTTHHGLMSSGATQLVKAVRPMVAIMNNGPRKGGSPDLWRSLKGVDGFVDLWQGHRNVQASDEETVDRKMVANFGETDDCQGHWIGATVGKDGGYTVVNSRNGFAKTYKAR
ncbi:MAG: MBL fold metallo-hydrolase [Acidobacteria bacterium]|nr:MBL fold metallo-hydrolase [Acidobacteriota bacterium]